MLNNKVVTFGEIMLRLSSPGFTRFVQSQIRCYLRSRRSQCCSIIKGYFEIVQKLKEKFNFKVVAITLRESYLASRNGWSAIIADYKDTIDPYHSKVYNIQIVDRVGGGDSFAGGLIYGLLNKENSKDALEFAVAASCLKQTIPGDFNLVNSEEVEQLIKSGGSGRIER